ncbi:pilus assembly protein FimV [Halopseudomonas litoralis]|uniref:Pilus assembly protein FimV n=1 Tax=Halopseudomonas litoralis TaxID=797277 RepID=A0A1H1RW46_9GAMM|nr:FimV/HubP family polar landmark protein [Halopseudomonas litoralis]SDS39960.1 pilus assembly protein FimV [Halopseudomonas litoralis]
MNVHRRVIVGVASLAALYAGSSYALGLGEVQLDSALNQPLNAVIELHGAEGLTPADIRVSLADAAAFSRVGIERPYFLTELRFTPVLVNQRLAVRVESNRPVNEPYLNFLVQLHRPGGLLLREYTVLLDPPLYQPAPVLTASAHVVAASESATTHDVSRPARQAAQPALPDLQPQPGAQHYQTAAGDSLWVIAQTTRPDETVPVRRQMLAIRALNPDAFVNGDINRLRTGQTLILPTAPQVDATGGSAMVAAPAASGPELNAETAAAMTQAGAPADPPTDVPASTADRARLRIEEPVLQAAAAENAQLHARLDEIESRFNALLSELDARDRQIASLQAEIEVLRRARDAELPEQATTTEGEAAVPADTQPVAGGSLEPAEEPPVAGAIERQVPDLTQAPAEPESAAEPAQSSNGWWAILLALLAGIPGVLVLRRQRRQPEAAPTVMPHPEPPPITVPGTRPVDPLEGVELYITYGRFVEARNMLDKAINMEPTRVDLRLSQLGVLAELGDAPAFAEQAVAVHALGGDSLQVEELKARYPQIRNALRTDLAQPAQQSTTAMFADNADVERSTLDLDGFDLDADWDLIDGLDAKSSDRAARRAPAAEPDFESNLTDFPEIGELEDDFSSHLERPGDDQRKDR